MARSSPTQRTLAECKERGWVAAVTERWNPHAHVRQDLFGFIDVLALDVQRGRMIAIQTTTGSNAAARVAKIMESDSAAAWVACGGEIWVWSWAKRGPRGKRKVWTLREEEIGFGVGRLGVLCETCCSTAGVRYDRDRWVCDTCVG